MMVMIVVVVMIMIMRVHCVVASNGVADLISRMCVRRQHTGRGRADRSLAQERVRFFDAHRRCPLR
jgi:hypothetical protein